MIDQFSKQFIEEMSRIRRENPESDVTHILQTANLSDELNQEQVDRLYNELYQFMREEPEFGANERIMKQFLKTFPYKNAIEAYANNRESELNRILREFNDQLRNDYIYPKLYLLNEEIERQLSPEGLTPINVEETSDGLRIRVQDPEGNETHRIFTGTGEFIRSEAVEERIPTGIPEIVATPAPSEAPKPPQLESEQIEEARIGAPELAGLQRVTEAETETEGELETEEEIKVTETTRVTATPETAEEEKEETEEESIMANRQKLLEEQRRRQEALTRARIRAGQPEEEEATAAPAENKSRKRIITSLLIGNGIVIGGATASSLLAYVLGITP